MLPRAIADIVGSTHTLEIKTHTYYEHGSFESFTCSAICADQNDDDSASSSTVEQTAASESTPIKASEENPVELQQSDIGIEEEKAEQPSAAEKRRLKKLSDDPSLSTPSKPTEETNKKRLGNSSSIHIRNEFKV